MITDANTDISLIWENIKRQLEAEAQPVAPVLHTYINPIKPCGYNKNAHIFTILAPNDTVMKFFAKRFMPAVIPIAREQLNDPDLTIELFSQTDMRHETLSTQNSMQLRQNTGLIEKYTFDNFVRGKSNELAFSACVYVAESVSQINFDEKPHKRNERNHYNPLFIYGGVGLGKTHLMHSIGNYVVYIDPSLKVLYTTAENLMNEFINSIKERKNQEFRDKYRTIDIIFVDDIQFLADKEGTQDEFFHTFNALYNANKQIVISSDRPPSELEKFHERLLSRFDNGTMVDISAPDFETRTAILEKKLELRNLKLPPEVIRYIAKNISSNIRALEGALNTVDIYAKLSNSEITLDLAERALKGKMSESEKRDINTDYIQEVVAKYFHITKDELKSIRRTQNIAYARHIAMYFCRMLIDSTHYQIGQEFGKRDHTSVIYACNKVAEEIETKPELKKHIFEIEKLIKG